MAIVNCSECQKEVSDKAGVCPHCGNPMQTTTTTININTPDTVKVEPVLVSKEWKKVKMIGWFVSIGGLFLVGFLNGIGSNLWSLGVIIVIVGLGTVIVGKIGAWYEDRTVR